MAPFLFQEIAGEGNFQTKMLFLVPMRLQATFESYPQVNRAKQLNG
jgi:hypothetical protein